MTLKAKQFQHCLQTPTLAFLNYGFLVTRLQGSKGERWNKTNLFK